MSWFFYLICSLVILAGGVLLGYILRDRELAKHNSVLVRYVGLTPKSKTLVNGYIQSREVNDERTTYRARQ